MRQLIVLIMAVLCGGVAYWALSIEFNTKPRKNRKPVLEPVNASRKQITPRTKARLQELAVELNKPRKTRSDKGKKRGPYKKGKQL